MSDLNAADKALAERMARIDRWSARTIGRAIRDCWQRAARGTVSADDQLHLELLCCVLSSRESDVRRIRRWVVGPPETAKKPIGGKTK